jgi:integrase
LQHRLGHKDLRTTTIYTQVIRRGAEAAGSPMDTLEDMEN